MAKLGNNRSAYSYDSVEVRHRNKNVLTTLNSPELDTLIQSIDDAYDYEVGYVPEGYEHRPDLISNVFYGTPKNWWLLMLVNNIPDPFEGFNVNEKILIPVLK